MNHTNEYTQCLETMFGLRRFGIKLGLETITEILSGLGDPHLQYKIIHIAGTNGKGSIASALSMILQKAGYAVGLYTSPHLVRFNERINVNNIPISDEDVVAAYNAVAQLPKCEREPTFFEFSTAMALHVFAVKQVDWAVIETGMGGRLDATNVVHPEISIISNISLEHQEYLGNTISSIAFEKGGIIKKNVPVITAEKQEEALSVLKEISLRQSAPFYQLGMDFNTIPNLESTFTYQGITDRWPEMQTGLIGPHQLDNAALTLACCEILKSNGLTLSVDDIRKGLFENRWPGRLEMVDSTPPILLDGAHNLAAAHLLAAFLKNNFKGRKIILVIGILNDKPFSDILKVLLSVCHQAVLTSPDIYRALPVEELRKAAGTYHANLVAVGGVDKALQYAMAHASDEDIICAAGSLYVVGEAKAYLETKGFPSFRRNAS